MSSQTTTSAQWKMLAEFTKMKDTIKERKQNLPPPPPTSIILVPLQDSLPQDEEWPAENHPPDPEPELPDTPPQANQPIEQPTRRSTRIRRPTKEMLDSVVQQDLEFHDFHRDYYVPQTVAFNTIEGKSQICYEAFYEEDYNIQELLADSIAFSAEVEKDTMYYHQAMKCPDKSQFKRAMTKEFNDHTNRKHWEITSIEDIPEGEKVIDSVWAMRRKRCILTNKIYKWKSRLNLHGGQQEYVVNFYETYSHVMSWASARLLLIHAIIYRWLTCRVDFTLAFPQSEY